MMTNRPDKLATLIAAGLLAVALAGCGSTTAGPEAQPTPSDNTSEQTREGEASSAANPADALPSELHGTWLLDVPRNQIGANLRQAGFARITERFFESEGLDPGRTTMTLTLSSDTFEIAWLLPDQTWDVGWYGSASMEGGLLHLADDYYDGVIDSFRPAVDGDELTLQFEKTNVDKVRGLPSESYSAAYFAQPWVLADCIPEDLDACL